MFPYEHVDCEERLNETELPPIECFYSSLIGQTISEKDYEHGKNVWSKFQIKDLGEYSDLYLKAEVFEEFRTNCLNKYI